MCAKPELISLKEEFKFSDSGRSFVAIVENVSAKTGVTLRFSSGLTKLVAMRDITSPNVVTESYSIGQIVRTAPKKTGMLSLKRTVVCAADPQAIKRDSLTLISAFEKLHKSQESQGDLQIGGKCHGKVQLVKDYGLIIQIDGSEDGLTGFIVNEQKASVDKTYKADKTKLDCIVLDIDAEKRIVDLSERLYTVEESKVSKKQGKEETS